MNQVVATDQTCTMFSSNCLAQLYSEDGWCEWLSCGYSTASLLGFGLGSDWATPKGVVSLFEVILY